MGKTNKIYFRKYRKQAFKKRYNKSKKRYNKSKKRYNKSKKQYKSKKRYNGGTTTNNIGSMQPNELQELYHTINTAKERRANARETKEINEQREIEQKKTLKKEVKENIDLVKIINNVINSYLE